MTTPTPLDYLKYSAAEGKSVLEYVIDRLGWLTVTQLAAEGEIETLQDLLEEVLTTLVDAAAVFSRDRSDANTYSDGRKVSTRLELETGEFFEYRWHPQPDHRDNLPHTRRSVIVSADQILDAIQGAPLHLVGDDD